MSNPMTILLSFTKGDFAESLVRNLFKASGYNSYVYGEWKAVSTSGVNTTEIGRGRTDHPDIRISNNGTDLHFLEVKFRAHGCIRRSLHERLLEQETYWSKVHPFSFVLVNCWSKPYFNVVDLKSARFTSGGVVYERQTSLMQMGWEKLNQHLYRQVEQMIEACRAWNAG